MAYFDDEDPGLSFARLRRELQTLAIPVVPGSIRARADAIALDFDHWCLSVLTRSRDEMTVRQRAILNALDAYFDELSGDGNENLWTEEAVREGNEWADVRALARQALEAFGWEVEAFCF